MNGHAVKIPAKVSSISNEERSNKKSLAVAIQEAEKEVSGGILTLTCWRAGKTEEVPLTRR